MKDKNIEIVKILKDKGLTLAIAESLTGGLVCSSICDVPGASQVLLEGVISYTDESKLTRLGVGQVILDDFSSVSPQVAEEMARGIRKNLMVDIGVSTTGVAGPEDYDENGNPRGLVYIAVSTIKETVVSKYMFEGARNIIREKAKNACLDRLYEILKIS